jgi:hypothetical protein
LPRRISITKDPGVLLVAGFIKKEKRSSAHVVISPPAGKNTGDARDDADGFCLLTKQLLSPRLTLSPSSIE